MDRCLAALVFLLILGLLVWNAMYLSAENKELDAGLWNGE